MLRTLTQPLPEGEEKIAPGTDLSAEVVGLTLAAACLDVSTPEACVPAQRSLTLPNRRARCRVSAEILAE